MQKLAVIIGGALLLAGVAAAGTFASLGSGGDNATISTKPAPRAAVRLGDIRREDRRADRRKDRATEARGRENEAGEDVRGRENEPGEDVRGREAEPNDDRGATVIAPTVEDNAGADDHSGRGSSNSGPGSESDQGGGSDDSGSGHGGGGGDD
jgi:hypothetical protein